MPMYHIFSRNTAGNNVGGVGCFLEQLCSQDVALSCDEHFFVIKSLVLVQQIMALNWFVLPAPPL